MKHLAAERARYGEIMKIADNLEKFSKRPVAERNVAVEEAIRKLESNNFGDDAAKDAHKFQDEYKEFVSNHMVGARHGAGQHSHPSRLVGPMSDEQLFCTVCRVRRRASARAWTWTMIWRWRAATRARRRTWIRFRGRFSRRMTLGNIRSRCLAVTSITGTPSCRRDRVPGL
jgi:hypothetical protein